MSNPITFVNQYTQAIVNLINAIETARHLNDVLTQDPTLASSYTSALPATLGTPRVDILPADINNAKAALVQVIFAYDSGAPTQKALLNKMLT